jgi:hypothetical protein
MAAALHFGITLPLVGDFELTHAERLEALSLWERARVRVLP